MKTPGVISYVVAAVFVSAGCVMMLGHDYHPFSVLFITWPMLFLMAGSESDKAVSALGWRDLWTCLITLAILAAAIFLTKRLVADSTLARIFRHPAFVFPLWVVAMCAIFSTWWRKKNKPAPVATPGADPGTP